MSQFNASNDLDVLVIGGGISGLSTAWWLAKTGLRVQVWEKSSRAGGKIKTTLSDGFRTEQAASMIMNFKSEVDQFFTESGLQTQKEQRLHNAEQSRYLINQGQLQPLPMTITRLLFSSLWSTQGKFRMLMEPFAGKAKKANESVTEFITRRLGSEFLEKAMEPFIAGTMASDPDLANARHVIPRLTALEQRFGSITAGVIAHKIIGKRTARNPESHSFKGGMESLTQHLANTPNINFRNNIQVQEIIQHNSKHGSNHDNMHWEVQGIRTEAGIAQEIHCQARHVVMSSPADVSAQLLQSVSPLLSALLAKIEYTPLSVVHIGLERSAIKHPLDSTGFLVPRQEKQRANMSINGNLWMSSIFPDRAPDNQVLLSSYLGGTRQPEAIHFSTEESIQRVLNDISPLLGITDSPIMGRIDKHHRALPLYHGQYHQYINAINNELPQLAGLHLNANYIGGVSVRDRIVCAKKTAETIIEQVNTKESTEPTTLANFTATFIETPA